MATVELRFTALPAHVRTARLVAVAVARLAGVDQSLLEEVRLVVGEACSRAVSRLQACSPVPRPVRVSMVRQENRFVIEVGDGPPVAPTGRARADDRAADELSLAVISGLVADLVVDEEGGFVCVSWPVAPTAGG
jgi:anti-sigma regulatory factor (Ser/Thr protein kinase)